MLICLEKLLSYVEDEDLKQAIDTKSLSSFLSKLSESNDIMIIALTLQIIDIMSPKIPKILIPLAREGLIDFINNLTEFEAVQRLEAHLLSNKRLTAPPVNVYSQSALQSQINSAVKAGPILRESSKESKIDTVLNKFKAVIQKLGINVLPGLSVSKKSNMSADTLYPPSVYGDNQNSNSLQRDISNDESRRTIADDRSMNDENDEFSSREPVLKGSDLLNHLRKQSVDSQSFNREPQTPVAEKSASKHQTSGIKTSDMDIESSNSDKGPIAQIRLEILEYAKEIQKRIEMIAIKADIDLSQTQYTLRDFILISESLVKNRSKRNEFGIYVFQALAEFINQNTRITNYELKQSHLIQSLMFFILDGTIERKNIESRKFASTSDNIEEEKSVQMGILESQNVDEGTCLVILGRIIAFLSAFKTKSSLDSSGKNF